MKRKGKTIAIVAGAVVVILGAIVAPYWAAIYFRLVPEARFSGSWEIDTSRLTMIPEVLADVYFREGSQFVCRCPLMSWKIPETIEMQVIDLLTYRVEGDRIVYSHAGSGFQTRAMFRFIDEETIVISGVKFRRVSDEVLGRALHTFEYIHRD